MFIRPADRSDLHAVYLLWSELMDEHAHYHPIFGYHRVAQVELKQVLLNRLKEPYTRFFVAETPDGIAGMLIAMYQIGNNAMHYKRRGYVAETLVRPAYRRLGIGRKLFQTAKTWLQAEGADHLELQVAVTNDVGQRFWSAMGFAPTTYHLVQPLVPPPAPDEWPS